MKESLKKLKAQFDENPSAVIAASAGAVLAAAKLIDAVSGVWSKRAYRQQVRDRNNRK
uniref:Holin n=1 Tax=Streptomyces phage Scarif TaxID=3158858 RepID=A0AAU7GZM1_9CAUD